MSGEARVEDPEISELEALDLEGLRARWRRLYGPPPTLRSVELLRQLLAWRQQAEADPGAVSALQARLYRGGAPGGCTSTGVLRPGARLMREWRGSVHEVQVIDGGQVLHAGCVYDSLSAVARAITGVRWNGPRFFGLRP